MVQVFKTQVTEDFGIEHPIIQGGMMWVSQPELVAAVSEAGGLGVLTALTFETAEGLADAIARTRALTDRPFGVNLTFLPTLIPKDYGSLIDVMVDEGIQIVETAGRNPEPYMERIKAGGAKVVHKCTSVRFAKKAEAIGCDYVSIDGCECAGHPGEEDITSLVLIPATVDTIKIPVIASGGFADARGLVAALALGAEAMNMGTRFVATQEAPAHEKVKQWYVDASETDTMYVMRSLRNTERVLRNPIAEKVVELEGQGAGIGELAPLVSGQNGLRVLKDGDTDVGLMTAGQSVGLVHDVPTVRELIDTIISEAQQIAGTRIAGMMS
jgi:NAD(P)H-dependent flavin oxidoreductase YrpB (nitropropane dioxygenase family)